MMKNKKGFTLVELLVVIAIIGILSTVAVVNLNSARNKAKEGAALAQLDSLKYNLEICLQDGDFNLGGLGAVIAGTNICTPEMSLGNWPSMTEDYSYVPMMTDDSTYWYLSAMPTVGLGIDSVYCQSNSLLNPGVIDCGLAP